MGESDFSQFTRWRNRLVTAAPKFREKQMVSSIQIPRRYTDKDEQFKLAHRLVDDVDLPNKKICVTMLSYNVGKLESSYAQVQLFAEKNDGVKYQQIVYMNYNLDDIIYLLDLKNSVYDKVFANQPSCNVL